MCRSWWMVDLPPQPTARGQRRPVANSAGGSASPVARGRSSAAALRRGDDDVDGAAWSGTPIAADAEVCSATPAAYATRRANRPWVLAVTDVGHRDRGDGEPVGPRHRSGADNARNAPFRSGRQADGPDPGERVGRLVAVAPGRA